MLRPRSATAALFASVLIAGTVTAVGTSMSSASAATPTPSVSAAASTTPAPPGAGHQVTLITGDVIRVSVGANGRQQAAVLHEATTGPGAQFQSFNLGSDLFVVPQSALPYLGSTLDLALFDVTKLAAAGSSITTVQISYRSATAPAALPGITITQRSGASARGRVAPASGPAFGAALAWQWRQDHAAKSHTTGLFANVARIAPAAAPPVVHPNFVMETLTINGIDAGGAKDTGDSPLIYNVDNLAKYSGFPTFINGLAKVSVPRGRYAALCAFYDFTTDTVRMVITPRFSVTGDTAITLDARDATAAVSITTPKAADPQINEVAIGRADALGQTASYAFLGGGSTAFIVQPTTKRITVGQLYYYVYSRQFAADGTYTYDLEFPNVGAIPANQSYVVHDNDLAAVDSKYPASHPNTPGMDTRFAALPWQQFLFASDLPLVTPTERTEYYTALPNLNWQGVYDAVFTFEPFVIAGQYQSAWRVYQPATSSSTTWAGTPTGPRLLQAPVFIGQTICPACISGTTVSLLGYPFGDNDPEHFGFPSGIEGESTSYGVFADDVPVDQGSFLATTVSMPSAAQTYRIDYDTTRSTPDFLLSTAVQTRWTIPAAARPGPLPAGWVCDSSGGTDCGVLPLIVNSYHLPVNLLGQVPSGATTARLDLSHLGGSNLAFRTVKVKVSFNSGQTWRAATVTDQGSGHYALAFTVPAAAKTDGYGALQVSVRDIAAGTFNQTIQHAFAIGS